MDALPLQNSVVLSAGPPGRHMTDHGLTPKNSLAHLNIHEYIHVHGAFSGKKASWCDPGVGSARFWTVNPGCSLILHPAAAPAHAHAYLLAFVTLASFLSWLSDLSLRMDREDAVSVCLSWSQVSPTESISVYDLMSFLILMSVCTQMFLCVYGVGVGYIHVYTWPACMSVHCMWAL